MLPVTPVKVTCPHVVVERESTIVTTKVCTVCVAEPDNSIPALPPPSGIVTVPVAPSVLEFTCKLLLKNA